MGVNRQNFSMKIRKWPTEKTKMLFFSPMHSSLRSEMTYMDIKLGLMKIKCLYHHSRRNFELYGCKSTKFQHENQENDPPPEKTKTLFFANAFHTMVRDDLHGSVAKFVCAKILSVRRFVHTRIRWRVYFWPYWGGY